jgi:hypothetical protein
MLLSCSAGLARARRSLFAMPACDHIEKFAGKVRILLEKWPKVRNSLEKWPKVRNSSQK